MRAIENTPAAPSTWRWLREHEVRERVGLLAELWCNRTPFVLLPSKMPVSDDWLARALCHLPAETGAGHFVMLTSGSSGDPKLVLCAMARTEALAAVLHTAQDNDAVQTAIVTLPLSYSFAFVNQWVWSQVHHRALQLTPGMADPQALQAALAAAQDAMLCLVGVQVPLLLRYYGGQQFPGVIRVHFAGGRFPQEQLPELQAMFPKASIYNNYGCAEAMPRLTVRRAEHSDQAADVGLALPGIQIDTDADGALVFRSPYGAVGCVERDHFTAIGADTWVHSGDLALRTATGSWPPQRGVQTPWREGLDGQPAGQRGGSLARPGRDVPRGRRARRGRLRDGARTRARRTAIAPGVAGAAQEPPPFAMAAAHRGPRRHAAAAQQRQGRRARPGAPPRGADNVASSPLKQQRYPWKSSSA
jgi:hypothetical protein